MGACACVCAASMSNMDPSGVDCSPCLVEIRAARRCVVSLMLFFFFTESMMRIVGCYVGQAEKIGSVIFLFYFIFNTAYIFTAHKLIMGVFFFNCRTENENMATHSSRGGSETQILPPPSTPPKLKKATRRWCSASGFDLVAARTRHVWASSPSFVSHFISRVFFFRESALVGETVSCLANVVGEESFWGGGSGPTFSALAVNSRRWLMSEEGGVLQSHHTPPHGVRALVLLNRTSLLQPPWLGLV